MTGPSKVVYSTDSLTGRMRRTAREGIARVYEAPIHLTDETPQGAVERDPIDEGKARDVASSLRAMVDPMSGRIDNWSDR